jgi:hypothetical protein
MTTTIVLKKPTVIEESLKISKSGATSEIIENSDSAFINFQGTETGNASYNLSTLQGSGALSGPKDTGGWQFAGMIKIQIKDSGGNIVDRWIPHYTTG